LFIGHYGPAAAAAHRRLKLWHCFAAVQFLDLVWAPLVLLGVEKVRIVPGFTASNHFDLYYMPFTHSLPAALVWSAAAAIGYGLLRSSAGRAGAALIGALVFSHWLLDLVMHKPDLALWFDGRKVGMALWDHRDVAFGLEVTLFFAGMAIYWARSSAKNAAGRALPFITLTLGVATQIYGNWGPPPGSSVEAALSALVAYAIFTALAAANDASRTPR
jgi:hypothetical protein